MADWSLTLTGIQPTIETLRSMPSVIVARGFTQALSAAGQAMANELERQTPIKSEDIGGLLDRGVLRESVMVAVNLDSKLQGGTADVGFTHSNGADRVALWVEFGHRITPRHIGYGRHRRSTGKAYGRVIDNPFMRRAAAISADAAIDAFVSSIQSTIAQTQFTQFTQRIAA